MNEIIKMFGLPSVKTKTVIRIIAGFVILLLISATNSLVPPASGSVIVPQESPVGTTTPQNRADLYDVVKVIDGDTVDVSIDGKTERLRLIGIDTPETVDPRKPVQCFGREASNKAKELLTGKKVALEADPTQGERDKYSRLLRYVFLEDGTNFNLRMITEGYAHEYTYNLPYKYQSVFKDAQKQAMISKVGLWGNVCEPETGGGYTTATSTGL